MNASQERAVARVRAELDRRCQDAKGSTLSPRVVTTFDVSQRPGSRIVFVTAYLDRPSLPESNLLRLVDACHWLASIGPGGSIQIMIGPKALESYAGRRWCGFRIARRYTCGDL